MTDNDTYEIKVESSFREWWRYNVFISAACYASNGSQTGYLSLRDSIYEPSDGVHKREKPQTYNPARRSHLSVPQCARLEIYLYVIANTMPFDSVVKHSPPFEAAISVTHNERSLLSQTFEVNQWGGAALRFEIKEQA